MPRKRCAICRAMIKQIPVDGSDPDHAHGGWWEVYECEEGHTGRLTWDPDTGLHRSGALRNDKREEIPS